MSELRSRAASRALDAAICGALAASTVVYLWLWPRDFFAFDEGLFLYESKRVLDGDVFYRDIFEIITPGAHYVMALLFGIFGQTIGTAKMAMAAVHASIGVLIFLACRRAAARRSLAFTAGVAHLALGYPGMPMANPHWFGTLLTLLIAFLCLLVPWRKPNPRVLLIGLASGALLMVQQQKGAVIAAGVCCVLAADHFLSRESPLSSLVARLALFLAGVLLLALPFLLILLVRAGFAPMWEGLIDFPLHRYLRIHDRLCAGWGYSGFLPPRDRLTFPRVIAALPLLALLLPVRVAWSIAVRKDSADARPAVALSLLLAAATLSVYYCPNFTHLSLISPLGFVLLAETIEWPSTAVARCVPGIAFALTLAALGTSIGLGFAAAKTFERRWAAYPFPHETAAGVVDFRNPDEIAVLDAVRARTHPGAEIFAYPSYAGIYFLSATRNPTRFQILLRNYHRPEQFREVIETLDARKVPLVIVQTFPVRWKSDPIVAYLARAYKRVPLPPPPESEQPVILGFSLFERRAP